MKPDLLQWLCCPKCSGSLTIAPSHSENGSILEGRLTCRLCGAVYPVTHGIPRFVGIDGYTRSFSYEWKKWSQVQLDVVNGSSESENTFIEKTAFTPHELEGKLVLDAGCGSGRFLDVTSRWAARVIGVDFSYAVDAAQTNVGDRKNVDIVQADLFQLPFKKGIFDAVFSIGVLHHTKDTRAAFLCLPPLLKEGGEIAVWLYHYSDELYCKASDFWRAVFRHLPYQLVYAWCWLLVVLLSDLYRKQFMCRKPWLHLRHLLPVNTHPCFKWRVLDTFDWYSPRYQDKGNSIPRVARWYFEAGLRDVEILDCPTALRGRRNSDNSLPALRCPLSYFRDKRFIVFGAGSGGNAAFDMLQKLGLTHCVVAVCDNERAKIGRSFRGHTVRRFEDLSRSTYDAVIIASVPGKQAISTQLERAGLVARRDFATANYIFDYLVPLVESLQTSCEELRYIRAS